MTAAVVTDGRAIPRYGDAQPRVATARPRGRTRGAQVARFADRVLHVGLLPWQDYALRAGMVHASGRYQSRTVGVLVGRQNGKTRLTTVRALAGMVLWGEHVISAAQNRDVALEAWNDALAIAQDAGLDVHGVRRTNGQESFRIGSARYKVVAQTGGARGLTADLLVLDEVREWHDWKGWAALEKTRRARPSSQLWAITNEGDAQSVVLDHLANEGRAAAAAGSVTDSAWLEWSADPALERSDPRAWAQSNPALGHLISADTIRSEQAHDDPLVFDTEVLCRRVLSLRPWLPAGLWDATADPAASVPDGSEVVFALDAGSTSRADVRHATIAAGWRRPDGRTHVEAIGGWHADDGPPLPRAAQRLRELLGSWDVRAVIVAARTQAHAAAERALADSGVGLVAVTPAALLGAVNAFHEAVVARTIVHPPDAMSAEHVANVTSDGPLYPRSRDADVDGAAALILAAHGIGAAPAPVIVQDWVAY